MINKLTTIYFSPTNTTKKVIRAVAKGISCAKVEEINLADVGDEKVLISGDLAIIGVPVYSGRVPVVAAKKINQLRAENIHIVLIALYGNREYEDALIELYDLAVSCGFSPVAAASFIGEHSYSTVEYPIAIGRPDASDLSKAEDFGKQIVERGILSLLKVIPGNRPYKELKPAMNIVPVINSDNCNQCGTCVEVCPTNAISLNGEVNTNAEDCIMCCACIKTCPQEARFNDNEIINGISKRLNEMCSERKEPTFIW